ncbi:hypothetical protein NDU88_005797 [Pleurodeles waltl]|uniref:Uncharacterized protein n=1 Tax=Pleurodeles waltl TaxID=8319 RepID=A0AAV7TWE0_PLEWA|nr:hypothetical protein NDU88_005797 [Pleurodeles waltl]
MISHFRYHLGNLVPSGQSHTICCDVATVPSFVLIDMAVCHGAPHGEAKQALCPSDLLGHAAELFVYDNRGDSRSIPLRGDRYGADGAVTSSSHIMYFRVA